MAKLFATNNDLSKTHEAVVALLNARLLEAIDLQLRDKQAHWAVKSPQFIALHELLDQVADALDDQDTADLLYGRVTRRRPVFVVRGSAPAAIGMLWPCA